MVTTVEGLLYRMRDIAEGMIVLNDDEAVVARLREFMDRVSDALRGRLRFTVIIEDPGGNSAIRPPVDKENKLKITSLQE
jgi:zinc finger protein